MEFDGLEEEREINLWKIFTVIFGRKITFFSVWVGVFVIGLIVLLFGVEPNKTIYYANFRLIDNLEITEAYSDGQTINMYELVSLDNIKEIANKSGISKKAAEQIFYSNKFSVKKETSEKVEGKTEFSFRIEAPKKMFKNSKQVRTFMQEIANLPNVKQEKIIASQVNEQYLNLYDDAKTYDLQVSYLEKQYELLDKAYETLIDTYGDIVLEDGQKLSSKRIEIVQFFKNYSFESFYNQISGGGFVKGYENEKNIYQNEISTLTKEKNLSSSKLSDLISQRDDLINTSSNLQTVELSEYNNKIIELTLRIRDIDSLLEDYNLRIANLDKLVTDDDLKAKIADFESSMDLVKEELSVFTNDYKATVEYISLNNSITYFETTSLVNTTNTMNVLEIIAIPLIIGLVLAMLVNLCIDGKKLTKNYKLVHISMIKDKEENKTA